MTIQDKAKAAIPLLQAVVDKKTLQFKADDVWRDDKPENLETFLYQSDRWRIKPEPREWWVVETVDACDIAQLRVVNQSTPKSIRVREVL